MTKHAGASRVTVRTWVQGGRLGLSVCDNGAGLDAHAVPPSAGGRGLGSIWLRAQVLDAEVIFGNGKPGTCVTFLLQTQPPELTGSQRQPL